MPGKQDNIFKQPKQPKPIVQPQPAPSHKDVVLRKGPWQRTTRFAPLVKQGRPDPNPYKPTYYENPQNVAREWNKLQTLPKGSQPPDWLDVNKLNEAYTYFKYANGDAPWTEWKYLHPDDDLGRGLMQSMGTPPSPEMSPAYAAMYSNLDSVFKGEASWSSLAPDVRASTLADPNFDISNYPWEMRSEILSDANFDWSRVPAWHKAAFYATSNPNSGWSKVIPTIMGAIPAAVVGSAIAPGPGTAIGAVVGGIAGYRAASGDYDMSQNAFNQPTFIGGVFAGLNVAAEEVEKTLGLITQLGMAAAIPDHRKDFQSIQDLFTAYEAGLGFYEQIPATYLGKDIIIGRKDPIAVQDPGRYFVSARERIENGENYRMVAMEAQQYLGAQGTDFAMQMFGDPLNLLPYAQKTVGGKILDATGHPTAAAAMRDSSGLIEGIKTYGSRVQTGLVEPGFKYNEMNGLEQTMAGITKNAEGNPVVRAGKFAGGLLDEPKKGFLNYVTSLQPSARARIGLGLLRDNLGALMTMFQSPEEFNSFWNNFRSGNYEQAREMGARIAESPEMYTVMPAVKNKVLDSEMAIWTVSRKPAALIESIAGVLKRTGQDVVNDLATPAKAEQVFGTIKAKIAEILAETPNDQNALAIKRDIGMGVMTADDLVQAGKIFNGPSRAPLTLQQWKVDTINAMSTHFENWATDFFKLEPDSSFFRAAHMMKSAQSLLLLGFNPKYLVNNVINNMVSRIATGNFGYMTPSQIAKYIDDFGITPSRLEEGVGMVGEVHSIGESGNVITKALRETKGMIAKADNILKRTGNKIGVMSNLSRISESVEGSNAFVVGMKRAYNQLWRVGKGISRMDGKLEAAINKVYPGGSELMYRAIEAGMNQKHIESIITQGVQVINAKTLAQNFAKRTGLDPTQAANMLDELGVFEQLDLTKVASEADIRRVFEQARKKAKNDIDIKLGNEFKTRVEEVGNKITHEGWSAVHDTYIDVTMRYHEDWKLGFEKINDGIDKLTLIEDPVLRSTLWENLYRDQMRDWAATNAFDLAAYKGMAEAMGMGKLPVALDFLARKGRTADLWREAFQFRLDESTKHIDKYRTDWDNPARWDDWDLTQDRIHKKFEDTFQTVALEEIEMGKLFADQFTQRHGDEIGGLAAQYWKEVSDFREKMWTEQQNFRAKQKILSGDERSAASAKFWHERYPELITELEHMKIGGSLIIDETIRGRGPMAPVTPATQAEMPGTPPAKPVTPEPVAPAPAVDPAIYKAAMDAEYPVTSAMPDGSVDPAANAHILAIVRKYGGDVGKQVTNMSEVTKDLVQRAFADRAAERKLQLEFPKVEEEPTITPELQAVQEATLDPIPPEKVEFVPEAERLAAQRQEQLDTHLEIIQNKGIKEIQPAIREPMINALGEMKLEASGTKESLLQFIRRVGGLDFRYIKDITGESKSQKGWFNLFNKKGQALDLMAIRAEEYGYLTAADIADPMDNGGVNKLSAMISEELAGKKHFVLFDETGQPEITPDWYKAVNVGKNKRAAVQKIIDQIMKGEDNLSYGMEATAAEKAIKAEAFYRIVNDMENDPDLVRALGLEAKYDYDGWKAGIDDIVSRVPGADNPELMRDNIISDGGLIDEIIAASGELPIDAPDEYVQYYTDAMNKVAAMGEQATKLVAEKAKKGADTFEVAKTIAEADAVEVKVQAEADTKMTRARLREELIEVAGFTEERADTWLELQDANASWWTRVMGKSLDDYWAGIYDIIEGGDPELFQRLNPINRRMNAQEIANFAQALVRSGADELRRAIQSEPNHADCIALIDAAYKLDRKMAEGVAIKLQDLFQETSPRPYDGQSFFQEGNIKQGGINFANKTVSIFSGADATTVVHKFGGHLFPQLLREAVTQALPEFRPQLEADLRTLEDFAGVKKGVWDHPVVPLEDGRYQVEGKFFDNYEDARKYSARHHEAVSYAFERYMAEGIAPTPALVAVFKKIKEWMLEIYTAIAGSRIDVPLTDEVREVFGRYLDKQAEIAPVREPAKPLATEAQVFAKMDEIMGVPPKEVATLQRYADNPKAKPYEMLEADAIKQMFDQEVAKAVRNAEGWKKSLAEMNETPKRPKAMRDKAEWNIRWWEKVAKQTEPTEAQLSGYRNKYIKTVKENISHGASVPNEVIAQRPEFRKAMDARARYEKGLHTSFANQSAAIDSTMKMETGYKVKRQDGKAITPDQIAEIKSQVEDVESVLGPMKDIFENSNVTIAHTSGKHPFLSKAGGMYHQGDVTITVGVGDIKAFAHEWAHWMDFAAGEKVGFETGIQLYAKGKAGDHITALSETRPELIQMAKRKINDVWEVSKIMKADLTKVSPEEKVVIEKIKFQLGAYWKEPREIWARLVEQYVGEKGSGIAADKDYTNMPGWWKQEDFDVMRPMIKEELDRRLAIMRGGAEAEANRVNFIKNTETSYIAKKGFSGSEQYVYIRKGDDGKWIMYTQHYDKTATRGWVEDQIIANIPTMEKAQAAAEAYLGQKKIVIEQQPVVTAEIAEPVVQAQPELTTTKKVRTSNDITDDDVYRLAVNLKPSMSATSDLINNIRQHFDTTDNIARKAYSRALENNVIEQYSAGREVQPAAQFGQMMEAPADLSGWRKPADATPKLPLGEIPSGDSSRYYGTRVHVKQGTSYGWEGDSYIVRVLNGGQLFEIKNVTNDIARADPGATFRVDGNDIEVLELIDHTKMSDAAGKADEVVAAFTLEESGKMNSANVADEWRKMNVSEKDGSWDTEVINRQHKNIKDMATKLEQRPWQTQEALGNKYRDILIDLRKSDLIEIGWDETGQSFYALKGEELPTWLMDEAAVAAREAATPAWQVGDVAIMADGARRIVKKVMDDGRIVLENHEVVQPGENVTRLPAEQTTTPEYAGVPMFPLANHFEGEKISFTPFGNSENEPMSGTIVSARRGFDFEVEAEDGLAYGVSPDWIVPDVATTTPRPFSVGDEVHLPLENVNAMVKEVLPDGRLRLDNGRVVAATHVDHVAAQENMFGALGQKEPPKGPQMLFQETDPRTRSGDYDRASQTLFEGERLQDAWGKLVEPMINGMEEEAIKQFRAPKFDSSRLDAGTQAQLTKYLNQKKGEMATSKLAAVRYGEGMRDFAMLNYNRRYGFDKYLDVIAPYQFWYTRTMLNWAMRGLDKPAFYSNYARLNMMQNKYQNDLPERFRGKISIPAPWLPDWMGNELFIDPKRAIFPFANMLTPFETMARDNNYQMIETERILQEWAQDETYSQTQIADAATTRSGAVWEKAVAEAAIRREKQISNPMDFMSALLGPAWYLSMPAKALGLDIPYINPKGGGPETISELPLTSSSRAIKAVTQGTWLEPIGQLIGLMGKPEEWIRNKTGMPQYGEYGDYYVKRQISNMVVEGEITVDEAKQAMIEGKGEIYDAARQRVELELAMRIPGAAATYAALNEGIGAGAAAIAPSIFGGQILPKGELEYRGQAKEWNQAWEMTDKLSADLGGDQAAIDEWIKEHPGDDFIGNFFNKYPEYEAYLAKNKDEGELLRNFLTGQIWDNYMALSSEDRRIATAQMPDLFKQSFLNKETRSYDSIDTETLAMWARIFKADVPETPATQEVIDTPQYQMPDILGMPAPLQQAMDEYNLSKQQTFPGINDIQSIYFAVPETRRRKVLLAYPQLASYWDWRRAYLDKHPEVAQFMDQEFQTAILNNEANPVGMDAATAQKLLRYYKSDFVGDPVRTYDSYFADVSPTLKTQFTGYVLKGTAMGDGAYKELRLVWENAGKPQGNMDNWIKRVLIPTMP